MESYIPDLNFNFQNSNQMWWFEIFDVEDYELEMRKLSIDDMEKGNKNYLLKNDKATLGKFINIIRNFKGDVTLVKDTE